MMRLIALESFMLLLLFSTVIAYPVNESHRLQSQSDDRLLCYSV